ncbi:MAG: GerMN domain-containing protein [Actinomycetota bacterium]
MMRRLLALALAAVVVSSCALSTDPEPRDILDGDEPTLVNTTAAVTPQPGAGSTVYFLGPSGTSSQSPLVAVGRQAKTDPSALLRILFEGPTAEEQASLGVRTAIPAGSMLLSAEPSPQGTLTIDLSGEFLANAGDVLLDAVAQVVFTASQLPGVRRVRLLVDGEPQDWPTSSGTTTRDPLSVYDFFDRLPPITLAASGSTTTGP